MKSTIYKEFEQSGDEMLKSKLRDLTFQTLKNTINSIEALAFLHSLLNTEEHREAKMRLSLEQNLITMRNSYLQKTAENHTGLLNALIDIRKKIAMDSNFHTLGSEVDEFMKKVRHNWDSRTVDPEELRDNLTDILRIVDPDASSIPRVMSKQAYQARQNGNLGHSHLGEVNKNYISVGNENFGTQNSNYNPNMSTLQSNRVGQTPFNGSLGESSMMRNENRLTTNFQGGSHIGPRISSTHINHTPGLGTTITTSVGNVITPLKSFSPKKEHIGKPKYYRLDDNGNRIEIDGPLQTIGTPNRMAHSNIRPSPLGNSSIPQINIATNNSAFSTHPYSRSPRVSHSTVNMTPQRRPMGITPLTPSQMITPNTPPPGVRGAYNYTSPLRIFPHTPRIHKQEGNNHFNPLEKRVTFQSPNSGLRKVKVFSPGGRIIRIEGDNGYELSTAHHEETKPMSEEVKIMVADAKEDFSNPEVEIFDCDDCKFISLFNVVLKFNYSPC